MGRVRVEGGGWKVTYLSPPLVLLLLSCLSSLHLLQTLGEHGCLLLLEHDDQVKDGTQTCQDWLWRVEGGGRREREWEREGGRSWRYERLPGQLSIHDVCSSVSPVTLDQGDTVL